MKILALITARCGSKRLPGKNIRKLGGKPLVVWSIDVVKKIPEICDILVSTDDPNIAELCEKNGAYVPWLRPAKLATDSASSVDVALHAVNWYEYERGNVDGLLLLQPTSPFRTESTVRKGIELFFKNKFNPVLGVSHAHNSHPMWSLKSEDGLLKPFMKEHGLGKRSQDLPLAYIVNGSFYLIAPRDLRNKRSFYAENSVPMVIESPKECIDIDTEWDWKMAEFALTIAKNE